MMRYRDIEYTVVQGIERGVFKWSASVAGVVITGQEPSKSAAVAEAVGMSQRCQEETTRLRLSFPTIHPGGHPYWSRAAEKRSAWPHRDLLQRPSRPFFSVF